MLTYHVIIDKNMMINAIQTDRYEVLGLLTIKFFLYLFILGIIPSILLTRIKVKYNSLLPEVFKKVAFFILAIIIAGVIILPSYKTISAFTREHASSINAFLPLSYIRASIRVTKIYLTPKPKFVVTANDATLGSKWKKINKQNTVFVFILGETAREKNFSLYGYPKDTNSFLKNEKLTLFRNTQSCGTETAVSVPCMFSNFNRSNFSIKKAKYQDGLLDVLKKASFDVLWIENQGGCKNVCDRVRTHKIKHQVVSNYEGAYDDVVVAELKEQVPMMLKKTQPKFIVLHTMGSHGPTYYLRYPKRFEKFSPNCKTADLQQCSQEEIVNSYNNTIYYTSYVIEQIIAYFKKQPNLNVAILYISDHGESLGEHGMYLHGFPYKLAPEEQTTVPFIMWFSNGFQKNFELSNTCLHAVAKKQYSQDNIYHSILGLLKVESSTYNKSLDIFSSCK